MSHSSCIEKIECPKCGSSDGNQVFHSEKDGYTSYCFSCSTYDGDPYRDKPKDYKPVKVGKTAEQIAQELKEIGEYQTKDLPDRKLKRGSLEYFGVKTGVSEEDGQTVVSHFYPYTKNDEIVGYKVRIVEGKKFFSLGTMRDVDAFGWNQAKLTGSRKLFITAGEIDAMSLLKILKDYQRGTQYADDDPAVISVPKGEAHAAEFISKNYSKYSKMFKEIVYIGDQDEPGKKAAKEVSIRCPGILTVDLPVKDISEGLRQGISKRIAQACLFQSAPPKNTRVISATSLYEDALKPPEFGFPYPWKALTKITRGIRLGESVYFGSGVKNGKSVVVNALAAHAITNLGWSVMLVKPEEQVAKTYKMVAGQVAGVPFDNPEIEFNRSAFDSAVKKIGDKLFLLDAYQEISWSTLKQDIIYAASQGVKMVVIDPITNLTNKLDAATANTELQSIAQEISSLAMDLQIAVFLFCHLKSPDSGPPHERGGKVLSHQFAGSRAMMRSSNIMIGLEANRDPDLPEEQRNLRKLVVLENRESGETGVVNLSWSKSTGLFTEYEEL